MQTEFAKTNLPSKYCDVICGDILNLTSFDKDKILEQGGYDCVMIKSANHEIPLEDQEKLSKMSKRNNNCGKTSLINE